MSRTSLRRSLEWFASMGDDACLNERLSPSGRRFIGRDVGGSSRQEKIPAALGVMWGLTREQGSEMLETIRSTRVRDTRVWGGGKW
jgi:hypothetical protein